MKKVVITGVNGFIGRNLSSYLVSKNVMVYGMNRDLLLDVPQMSSIFEQIQPDVVIHLASYGNLKSQKDEDEMIATNILKTRFLISSLPSGGDCKFVFISSSSVYGKKPKAMREDMVLEPENMYGVTKASAELLVKNTVKNSLIIRPFSLYGELDRGEHFIPVVIDAFKNKKELTLYKEGKHDWVYIGDFIDLLWKLVEKDSVGVFNIGTGVEETNGRIFDLITKISGKKCKVKSVHGMYNDSPVWHADTSKLSKEIGNYVFTPLEDGLRACYGYEEDSEEKSEDIIAKALGMIPKEYVS